MPSPGLSEEQLKFLASRETKPACHSDKVADAEEAKKVQQDYVKLPVVSNG